jgi:hypothetical protein
MKDEFWLLRPLIGLCSGLLLLVLFVRVCRDARQERALWSSRPPAAECVPGSAGAHGGKTPVGMRAFPPGSLPGTQPGTSIDLAAPIVE